MKISYFGEDVQNVVNAAREEETMKIKDFTCIL
jgi:hypothetical protein